VPVLEDIKGGVGQAQWPIRCAVQRHANPQAQEARPLHYGLLQPHQDAHRHTPLRDDEIVAYLLTGLHEDFDSLVTSVTTRTETNVSE
jgi:hypothetical protein